MVNIQKVKLSMLVVVRLASSKISEGVRDLGL